MNRIYYIVRQGDTLGKLAIFFDTSIEDIMVANRLPSDNITVGQRLIIPVEYYHVKPGDNLYDLARLFYTTEESIIALNELSTNELTVGQPLKIPLYTEASVTVDAANIFRWAGSQYPVIATLDKGTKVPITLFEDGWYQVMLYNGATGYLNMDEADVAVYDGSMPISNILGFYTLEEGPALPSSYESFSNNTDALSTIGMFMYQIDREDPTKVAKFGGDFTDDEVRAIVDEGHRNNLVMLPTVHNLLYERGKPEINEQVVHEMLLTEESQNAFIESLITLVEDIGFDGINMDIEDAYEEDEERISSFYEKLGWALNQKGYILSADVPSRTTDKDVNPFSDPYDYEAIGAAVDEFVVMLYNEHGWPGSGPGPVVSAPGMRRVLDYTITKVPPPKVMAAISVFGFDFNLNTGKAAYATYQNAIDKAAQYNVDIVFDEEQKTPKINYVDEAGDPHELWFENGRSIYEKAKIAWDYGIKGIALWRLGMEDPEVFQVLRDDIIVQKRV